MYQRFYLSFYNVKKDERVKLKGITSESHPKLFCCFRLVNYICMKTFLTSKWNVSKEVDKNDNFYYWNQLNKPGQMVSSCIGGSKYSVYYCHNGVKKMTINLILQFIGISKLYVVVFGKFLTKGQISFPNSLITYKLFVIDLLIINYNQKISLKNRILISYKNCFIQIYF